MIYHSGGTKDSIAAIIPTSVIDVWSSLTADIKLFTEEDENVNVKNWTEREFSVCNCISMWKQFLPYFGMACHKDLRRPTLNPRVNSAGRWLSNNPSIRISLSFHIAEKPVAVASSKLRKFYASTVLAHIRSWHVQLSAYSFPVSLIFPTCFQTLAKQWSLLQFSRSKILSCRPWTSQPNFSWPERNFLRLFRSTIINPVSD